MHLEVNSEPLNSDLKGCIILLWPERAQYLQGFNLTGENTNTRPTERPQLFKAGLTHITCSGII